MRKTSFSLLSKKVNTTTHIESICSYRRGKLLFVVVVISHFSTLIASPHRLFLISQSHIQIMIEVPEAAPLDLHRTPLEWTVMLFGRCSHSIVVFISAPLLLLLLIITNSAYKR